jgi:hypothetical protein
MSGAQEIRRIADEYTTLTGDSLFMGVEHPTPSTSKYMFDKETFTSHSEALGYAQARLNEAIRNNGGIIDHSECTEVGAFSGRDAHRHEGVKGAWVFPTS